MGTPSPTMIKKISSLLGPVYFSIGVFSLVAFAFQPAARAQNFGGFNSRITDGTAYYTYARPGEATMEILVIGSERSSGIYEVGHTTRMDELLALSGVLALASRSQEIKTRITIRLYRESEGTRSAIYEAPIETMLLEPSRYPDLQEGDVLTIETTEKTKFNWRDGISILSSLVSILWIVDRLSN